MSIHVALHHVTEYRYDRLVELSPQIVRLRPAPHCRTRILSYSLKVEPAEHFINWQQDAFANHLARLVFPTRTKEFRITVDLVAEMAVYNPFDFFLEPQAQEVPFLYSEQDRQDLAPYLAADALTPKLAQFVKAQAAIRDRMVKGKPDRMRTIDFLVMINQQLQKDITYSIRMEPGVQTPEHTLTSAVGSCRDTSWLLVQILRRLGLAARFVSGYLIQLKPDVKAVDGPSGPEKDFTDLHAWCEVYLPGAGWIGLDPTSGLLAGEGHIPVACTPTPSGAAPISGGVDECEVEFGHKMAVQRIYESPRVTQPYSDAQWQAIDALGEQVDAQLAQDDVRLTMGGEPTFVADLDRDGAEWNTDALGPTKRSYATALVQKLRAQYGRGGFLHYGQGKWYPGEQLPRWALSIYWRKDGLPCWKDPSLFADERASLHYTTKDAERFIQTLTHHLGLSPQFIMAGYEDIWYYLWRERKLPVNVDPRDSKLDDEAERVRLRRVFDQPLGHPVGYVLPIKPDESAALNGPKWITGPWHFRDDHMYLIPGDSSMGYRLPLDSLPWVSKAEYPYLLERDPFAPPAALPAYAERRLQMAPHLNELFRPGVSATSTTATAPAADAASAEHRLPALAESAHWITRTALCVEVRDPTRSAGPKAEWERKTQSAAQDAAQTGALYVFMPPLARLEDYLELLAAVEATAQDLGVKIILEGYPPPRDARLTLLQVTPDPGVIEVNIHPASHWRELVDHTEFLYQAAHEVRLSTEKFMLDGRHTGTGGGNHFVLGGATPPDSPFLRRPDLLPSLLTYWHNHPSLSYLFSGLFIGPTSQAPRVDEARNDQIYELEIALREIDRQTDMGVHCPPWLIDRTLRNLLIDVTGNTHRSEFCIDKLYSPDGSTGRLGLVELRAFEMPPHAKMSLVQQLLLRSLVAWFWRAPYRGLGVDRLTRWGTGLHDRFMLPTFLSMDFNDVIADLNTAGFAFQADWFAPHFEFRFPLIGELATQGIQLSLRTALEPWHVMGEEGSAGGTVRYVDSSVERVELKVSGLNHNRYAVTVNGEPLALHPTGRVEEFVAGVRYRAWNPPSALHPTVGVHAPLTFDIVDTWSERSIGGCQYHVVHPGGRSYNTFPINSYEAESRRLSRFFRLGHTPGVLRVSPGAPSKEFPLTYDLRR